jgi:hypothetical protein
MVAKKASSKKKASAKKKTTAAASAAKVKLDFGALDPSKLEAIQRCLAKGKLAVTVSRVSLGKTKIKDPWLYD